MTLRLVSHPLPVAWDGVPVVWDRWQSSAAVFICPPPKGPRCGCGSNRAPWTAQGLRGAGSGADRFTRPHPLYDLHAFRCPDCGQVDVWDSASDEWWTLDESDYGPDGSTPPPFWGTGGLLDLLR